MVLSVAVFCCSFILKNVLRINLYILIKKHNKHNMY